MIFMLLICLPVLVPSGAVGPAEAAYEGVAVLAAGRTPPVPQGGVGHGAVPGDDRLPVGPVRHGGGDGLAVVAHPTAARPPDPQPDRVVGLVDALSRLEGLPEHDVLGGNSIENLA